METERQRLENHKVTLRLTDEMKEGIKICAKRQNRTMSNFIINLLQEYLDENLQNEKN